MRISDKSSFVEAANLRYNFKFDYSKFEYVNAKNKSIIICPLHGDLQMSSDTHMKIKFGCRDCSFSLKDKPKRSPAKGNKVFTVEKVKSILEAKFPNDVSFDFSKCQGLTLGSVTITCLKHSLSKTKSATEILQRKHPCEKCRRKIFKIKQTRSYMDFLKKALEVHGKFYSYDIENEKSYINRKSKVIISCPKHGLFTKTAQKHLSGQGCFKCRIDKLKKEGKLQGDYSRTYFENNPESKSRKAWIYYIKVGELYKIGITTNLKNRLRSIGYVSKLEVLLLDSIESELYLCWELEQKILKDHSKFRLYLDWSSEVFDRDVLKGDIL